MSVYKRCYRPYNGVLCSPWTRFSVLVRYAFLDIWSSRITNLLFAFCLIPTLISIGTIYVMNNDAVRLLVSEGRSTPAIAIDQRYFFVVVQVQCWCSLVLTAWVGPKLLSGELSNNALPTILSHPISRVEYIVAKLTVLAGLLLAVTMLPGLLLFFLQSHMSALPWARAHSQIATGILIGCSLWVLLLSMLALAVASWVKWRVVATGMVFATVLVPAGTGAVFNRVMRTDWGDLVNVPVMMNSLWRHLLAVPTPDYYSRHELPVLSILIALSLMILVSAATLNARIRAREVVRG
jgi:ABC-type transport system involved in multi-copper enzyme maturation permease subunit